MKLEIAILTYLFFSIYSFDEYQLSFDVFLSGEIKFDLKLVNKLKENENIFYSGSMKNIDEIISNINKYQINENSITNYPLIYILQSSYVKYISYFKTNTKFIILQDYVSNLKKLDENYTIFSISDNTYFSFYAQTLTDEKYSYVKIGKKMDKDMEKNLYFVLFFNTSICIIISIILRNKIKHIEIENQLPIYFLICSISDLLFVTNVSNDISYLFFRSKDYFFLTEYMTLFMYSFYKSIFYTSLLFILSGWSIISFYGIGEKFKKINKRILLYDLLFTILILLSNYFFHFTSKLYLFYLKNITEHLSLLIYTIVCIIKKLLPLLNQYYYEQSIRSDLVKCIKFKFIKLFLVSIMIISYTLLLLDTPFFEEKYIYDYIDNFSIHLIYQLFIENLFILILGIIFYPKKLPNYYFDDVIFNYKKKVFLLANISEKEKDKINNKLNISNLTFAKLKKISKKDNYPIVLINPFISPKKRSLFNEVHIGIAQP